MIFGILMLTAWVKATNVVILNDLHLDPFFDPMVATQNDCRSITPFKSLGLEGFDYAPYGRYGCDVPTELISMFMRKIKELAFEPDVILVSGDYTAHDIAAKKGVAHDNYSVLKATIADCFGQYIGPLFPNSVILPAIGNNDAKWHYQFPLTQDESDEYYGFLYDLWFNQMPTNNNYTKKDEIKETFIKGGYFTYEYSEDLTFMVINSLYFSVKNAQYNSTVSLEQLDWIENTLKNAPTNKKFILNMHVFPGMYNPGERQQFWVDSFNNRFDDIMRQYGGKVILLNGAHTHISDIRASYKIANATSLKRLLKGENEVKVPYYNNFVSPSFSPFYLNNPGFTSFNLDNNTIHNVTTHFLELDLTYSVRYVYLQMSLLIFVLCT